MVNYNKLIEEASSPEDRIKSLEAQNRRITENGRDQDSFEEVLAEVNKARGQHSSWPDNVLEATAIISEESGEAIREALQITQGEHQNYADLRKEVIQTAAVCIRWLSETNEGSNGQ